MTTHSCQWVSVSMGPRREDSLIVQWSKYWPLIGWLVTTPVGCNTFISRKSELRFTKGSLKISLDISYFFLVFFCQHNNHHFMPKPHQLSCGLTLSAWFNTVHWSLHCTALVTLSLLLPVTTTPLHSKLFYGDLNKWCEASTNCIISPQLNMSK